MPDITHLPQCPLSPARDDFRAGLKTLCMLEEPRKQKRLILDQSLNGTPLPRFDGLSAGAQLFRQGVQNIAELFPMRARPTLQSHLRIVHIDLIRRVDLDTGKHGR
jgi:hypothetical protein